MGKLNKNLILVFTLLFATFLTACGGQETTGTSSKVKKIKIANLYATNHSINVALTEKFKPIVEEKSNGAFEVEIYGDSQLGTEYEFLSSARAETIQMAVNGTIMNDVIPAVEVPALPFLFNNYEEAKKILDGPIGKEIAADFEEKLDMHFLGYGTTGFRNFTSNSPVREMDDFKKLRVRMADGYPILMETAKVLGTSITPLPFSEVFTAIETGVIDSQENPVSTIISAKFYEVQDYMTETRHSFSPQIFHMSKKFWDTLSDEEKGIIEEAMKETLDYQWELMRNSEEENKKYLEDNGMEIIVPDEEFKEQLKEKAKPVYDFYYELHPETEELVEKIRKALNE